MHEFCIFIAILNGTCFFHSAKSAVTPGSGVLLRGWITKKHQKFKQKKCKFITIILLGTMSKSFKKIVRIGFELRALVWG